MTPQEQSELDKQTDALTVRLQKAQNGYILKTKAGPLVFITLEDAFIFLKQFFK